jgi:protease I
MANQNLKGFKVAILVENGFEQVELTEPQDALQNAGAKTTVISPQKNKVRGWNHKEWGDEIKVDLHLDSASAKDFDALLLPGGVMNPDKLRMHPKAIEFIKAFFKEGKPVAAICHGPWTIIEAGEARGRKFTSWPSLKTDLKNAGAEWVDQEVVIDGNMITSRKPDDLPAFNQSMTDVFSRALADAKA